LKVAIIKGLARGLKVSLVLLVAFFLYYIFYLQKDSRQVSNNEETSIGGSFELLGAEGKIYTEKFFLGKPLLIFFGFASCPDICPYGLSVMSGVLDDLKEDKSKFNVVFVTLDPERDDYKKISEFVNLFNPSIIGLSGSVEQINEVANNWRVYRKKIELSDSEFGYSIDHSAFIYLMDKDGSYLKHFSHSVDVEDIIKELSKLL
tara:strand:+ start:1160 stop:1771 length:612 start_codon:yes stop_codon:yes gene_type:complete